MKRQEPISSSGFVNSYAVELKPSARQELESLSDTALARVIRKIQALAC